MAMYVDNKKFHEALVEYKKTGSRKSYNEIGKFFLIISQRMLQKLSFINYSEDRKNEMCSLACLYMIRYLKNYNTDIYKNAFSYFSQISYNAYLQVIIINKKRDLMFSSLDLITSKDNIYTSESYNCEED